MLGEHQVAIESFEAVFDIEENHWLAAYNQGAAYFSSGQVDEAIQAYSLAARLNPQDADIHFNLGLAYGNAGDLEKARDAYVKSMAITPDDADVHYNLGRLYRDMGFMDDAVTPLEIAIALRPDFGAALTNLGVLYVGNGMLERATVIYEKLVEIDHNPVAARHILNALQGNTTDSAPLLYIKELYDDFAGHFDKRLVEDLCYAVPLQLVNLFDESGSAGQSVAKMLDLGCGTGLCGQAFSGRAYALTGVDLSAKMIEKARLKGLYDELVQSDILSFLENSVECFDLIVAADVFIYLGELESIFHLLPKSLSADGKFMFSTESTTGKGYRLRTSGRYAHSTSYISCLAQESGLQILAVESVDSRKENGQWIPGDIYILGRR